MNKTLLLISAIFLVDCGEKTSQQSTQLTAAMFRGDPQHSGVYATKAVHQFKQIKWAHKTNGAVRSSPAVTNDAVYFGSGDGYLYAVDIQGGQEKWRCKTEGAVHSSPAVANGVVYFTSRDNCLYAVEAQSGKPLLKFQTGEPLPYLWGFDYYVSSPLVVNGVVYFGSEDGHLYALDVRSGKSKWKFDTKSRVRSSPAMADNVIYFGDMSGYFYAIDRDTGAQSWRFETAGVKFNPAEFGYDRCAILSSAAISGDLVTFGGRDGFLYALDRQTGQEKWRRDYEISWVISSPAIFNDVLFTGTSDGRFAHAVDLNTGKEKWRFSATETVWSSPVICDSLIYFGDGGGNVFALDNRNGTEKWRFKTKDRVFSSPVVAEGVVYIGSDDGYLYALTGTDSEAPHSQQTRRAVFWEASTGFNWFRFGADAQIRDYFVREGYEQLDAKALAQFMQDGIANKTPSVVVFAASRVPVTVINDSSEAALLRQYLNAGGKVVWLGAPPLAYKRDPKTDQVVALDFTIPARIIGVRYPGNSAIGVGGWYQSTVTAEGIKWGLMRDWWIGGFAVDADQVTTVMARDETGRAAAWVKNYGGPEGTGLIQLWHKRDGQEDLIAVKAVAEYGLR
jgi:outer membrane protein assembly factor BamB